MLGDDGAFEILERVNDNAYKVNLLGDYGISGTFNMADLRSYLGNDYIANLRENSPQQGEDDGGTLMSQPVGPQKSRRSLSLSTKVQGIIQPLLSQSSTLPGIKLVHKPNFVHLIS